MADEQIKQTVAKVLGYVEKVSSFASSINPIFGIVTSLIGVVRKGLVEDEDKQVDKGFQQIHDELKSISEKNNQLLQEIRISEVNENYGIYEEYIKHQYSAFNTMVESVRKDPDSRVLYMKKFEKVYENDKNFLSLDVYYNDITDKQHLFGRPLLTVYLEHCSKNRKIMEGRCAHLTHLFQIGLISLMAYYSVTENDEEKIRDTWTKRVLEIQDKMEETLSQCSDQQSSV